MKIQMKREHSISEQKCRSFGCEFLTDPDWAVRQIITTLCRLGISRSLTMLIISSLHFLKITYIVVSNKHTTIISVFFEQLSWRWWPRYKRNNEIVIYVHNLFNWVLNISFGHINPTQEFKYLVEYSFASTCSSIGDLEYIGHNNWMILFFRNELIPVNARNEYAYDVCWGFVLIWCPFIGRGIQ